MISVLPEATIEVKLYTAGPDRTCAGKAMLWTGCETTGAWRFQSPWTVTASWSKEVFGPSSAPFHIAQRPAICNVSRAPTSDAGHTRGANWGSVGPTTPHSP